MLLKQQRAEECRFFFRLLTQRGHRIALTAFALYSIELHLMSHEKSALVKPFLADCERGDFFLTGTGFADEGEILDIANIQQLDIDDAHQYWAAKKLGAILVSFERDFDRTDITRLEPSEVLQGLSR